MVINFLPLQKQAIVEVVDTSLNHHPSTLYFKGAKQPASFYGLSPKVQLIRVFRIQIKVVVETYLLIVA